MFQKGLPRLVRWLLTRTEKGRLIRKSRPAIRDLRRIAAGIASEFDFRSGKRPNEQVNVFRHHDVRQKQEPATLARLVESFAKPGSPQIVRQERTTLKARKRQLVHIGLLLKMLDLLSMRQLHAAMLTFRTQPSTVIS